MLGPELSASYVVLVLCALALLAAFESFSPAGIVASASDQQPMSGRLREQVE